MLASETNSSRKRRGKSEKMEVNVSALETTLNEIKTAYSGISSLVVLDDSNQVIAKDRATNTELAKQVSGSFEKLSQKASIIGRIESLTFKGTGQSIFFNRHENIYLATIATNQISQKEITRLTNILFPTTLKVIQEVVSRKEEKSSNPQIIEPPKPKTIDLPISNPSSNPTQTMQTGYSAPTPMPTPEPALFNKPAKIDIPEAKFRVENFSGFSVVSSSLDSVLLDRALIGEWRERYGENSIDEVSISDVQLKKTVRCKFQAIKNSKLEGTGAIQVSHKLQTVLGVNKGSSVVVKPVLKEILR